MGKFLKFESLLVPVDDEDVATSSLWCCQYVICLSISSLLVAADSSEDEADSMGLFAFMRLGKSF